MSLYYVIVNKNTTTVVYEAAGDSVKTTTDGTSSDGKTMHTEWTGKFAGKDYPVTGSADTDSREYTKVNAHTTTFANKKRRQSHAQRQNPGRGGRQKPRCNCGRHRFFGQESHQYPGL